VEEEGEVETNPPPVVVKNPPVPSPVYYKYPPKAPVKPVTPPAPVQPELPPENRSEPPPQKVVYYRQEETTQPKPFKKYTYKTTTPKQPPPKEASETPETYPPYFREQITKKLTPEPFKKYTYQTTTPKKPLLSKEVPEKTTESYGEVYPALRRITTTTEKVSTSPEPKQKSKSNTFSIFDDNSINELSFGFPDGSTKFEIPPAFRTFLNTPPKWINMENW